MTQAGEIAGTIFRDVGASSCDTFCWSFDELADKLRGAKTYPSKADCPLIKLATFGDRRSDKGSLRNDANIKEVFGIEADYDGEEVSTANAQMLLYEQSINAIVYTSPSHTEEKPRWRVLCPLSQPHAPRERARFVARLNGALGGILAPESFVLSQSYYAGRVEGATYEVAQVRGGNCIDQLDSLDASAVSPLKNGKSRAEKLDELHSSDPVIERLTERGLLLRARSDGGADIACPFEGSHTSPRAPGDCTYFPPHTGGFAQGHFKCLHSHCAGRSDGDFMRAIGLADADDAREQAADAADNSGAGQDSAYDWTPDYTKEKQSGKKANGSSKSDQSPRYEWPESLDLEALSARDPEAPKFIMTDWLPCGYMTLFAGHGGVGKSGIALHLAVCIASGIPFFGMPVERRRVIYLSCEDRESLLHWRLKRICDHLKTDMAALRGWLEILDLVGHDAVLWDRDPKTGNTVTAAFGRLEERVKQYESELIVADGITDTFNGAGGSSSDIKRFVNALVSLIPADRGAVVLIGHIAKSEARGLALGSKVTEGYSGAAGWHNSARARWYLYPETEKDEDGGGGSSKTGTLFLELQKSNLGRLDQKMEFAWDDDARLFVGHQTVESAFDRKHEEREEQAGILRAMKGCAEAVPPIQVPAAMQGPRTVFHVLCLRPEFPESLRSKAAKGRFRRRIEELRQIHAIEEREYRRSSNRHAAVELVLSSNGLRQCV